MLKKMLALIQSFMKHNSYFKCLNLRGVIKAPDEVIGYVIIHELCHFLIKDHSHPYWNLLKAYVKDYKEKLNGLT
jgi:predicted metal-dependent hydrolase